MKRMLFMLSFLPVVAMGQEVVVAKTSEKKVSEYEIGFKDSVFSIGRNEKNDVIKELKLVAKNLQNTELKGSKLKIEVDLAKTTLVQNGYELINNEIAFENLKDGENSFLIKLNKELGVDREREIHLKMSYKIVTDTAKYIAKRKDTLKEKMVVQVAELRYDSLVGYSYLGYIGTNFDLVDGIKAKNLFFAANILIVNPGVDRVLGGYVSLYGNRTLTDTDTPSKVIFGSSKVINDTAIYVYKNQATLSRTRVYDNLGASLNPLFKITTKSTNLIDLYGSALLEFVWRRGSISTEYKNLKILDSSSNGLIPITKEETLPENNTVNFNQYDFYIGGGFVAIHENPKISVRLFMNLAYHASFIPQNQNIDILNSYFTRKPWDISFIGRLWITEPKSGITIQAEIMNNLKSPQPYYGVTLSKAFNLEKIGSFLAPVTQSSNQ